MIRFIFVALGVAVLFWNCASKSVKQEWVESKDDVDLRPIALHWQVAPEVQKSELVHKDDCVILLTSELMKNPILQASKIENLDFEVLIESGEKNFGELKGNLYFKGFCKDSNFNNSPECNWTASCFLEENQLKGVVNFNNRK